MSLTELLKAVQEYAEDEQSNMGNVPRYLLSQAITLSEEQDAIDFEMYEHGNKFTKLSCLELDRQRASWKNICCNNFSEGTFTLQKRGIENAG